MKAPPSIEERLERLERFASLHDPQLWKSTAPHVFVPGDVIRSAIPRQNGMRATVQSVHTVGEGDWDVDVFYCLSEDGKEHLFRQKEMFLVKAAETCNRIDIHNHDGRPCVVAPLPAKVPFEHGEEGEEGIPPTLDSERVRAATEGMGKDDINFPVNPDR